MGMEEAIRFTEILLAFALFQQSIEHVNGSRDERILFIPRVFLSVMLMLGIWAPWACLALVVLGVFILHRFQGPYNGGSDRMGILILFCLAAVHFSPTLYVQEFIFGYLAVQLVLSYFISGWVKIVNPQWRNGRALMDVFCFSAYPVSEHLRGLVSWPRLLYCASWGVMLFELVFPFALMMQGTLFVALLLAGVFHFANACLFGLNRFFWFWLAAYPSLIWFQDRVFGM